MTGGRLLWLVVLAGCGRLSFDRLDGDARGAPDTSYDGHALADGALGGANVQTTTPIAGTNGLTFTLEPTRPGTLLVASIAFNSLGTVALPDGWQLAAMNGTAGGCSAMLAYQLANSGGITSLTFTLGGNTPIVGMLTEWTGATAFDAMGSTVQGQPSASQSVRTSAATTASELAITMFCEDDNNPTYTPGAGWTQLGTYTNVASSPSLASDAQTAPAGTVSETVTSSVAGKYAAAIATFR